MSSDPLIGKPQKIIGFDSDFLNAMEYVSVNGGEYDKHTNKFYLHGFLCSRRRLDYSQVSVDLYLLLC